MAPCSISISPNNLCRYTLDDISVVCQIAGPQPYSSSQKSMFNVHVCSSSSFSQGSHDVLESLLRSVIEQSVILDTLPSHCQFGVQLNVIQSGSGKVTTDMMAACLNALCLALIDSGLPMSTTFFAMSIASSSNNAHSAKHANDSNHGLLYVLDSCTYSIMVFYTLGSTRISELNSGYETAKSQCDTFKNIYRSI